MGWFGFLWNWTTGTAAVTLKPLSASASGQLDETGSAAVTLPKLAASGSGTYSSGSGYSTPTRVDSAHGFTSTVSFSGSSSTGDFIVVAVECFYEDSTLTGVSDNLGQTYTPVWNVGPIDSHFYQGLFYKANSASGVTSVTAQGTFTGNVVVLAGRYTGVATSSALDTYQAPSGTAQGTPWASASIDTAQSTELLIGYYFHWTWSAVGTVSLDGSWSQITSQTDTNGDNNILADWVATSTQTGATFSGTATGDSPNFNHVGIAAFKAAGSAGISGTAAVSLPKLSASASGKLNETGTIAATLKPLSVSASGILKYSGVEASTLKPLSASIVGHFGIAVTGTASITLPKLSASAAGILKYSGTGAVQLPRLLASGAGLLRYSGTASASLKQLSVSAVGTAGQLWISITADVRALANVILETEAEAGAFSSAFDPRAFDVGPSFVPGVVTFSLVGTGTNIVRASNVVIAEFTVSMTPVGGVISGTLLNNEFTTPANTAYEVVIHTAAGGFVASALYRLSGSDPIDLTTLTPLSG